MCCTNVIKTLKKENRNITTESKELTETFSEVLHTILLTKILFSFENKFKFHTFSSNV